MKILAIRGRNLASLAGDFALELAQPPLRDAGLFAISGPTGAGKSTLLDALCLALYNRTPRLSGQGEILEGDKGENKPLRTHDPRTLLRRGCGEGHAEVDFYALDGKLYRAQWRVRRARNAPNGRIQPQDHLLMRLPDEHVLCNRLSQTGELVGQMLGLDYHQFTRSVLLAQGEFAAFLSAAPRDRAALLERVTGTALYAKLGMAAFKKAKDEESSRKMLEKELSHIPLLDREVRDELEKKLADVVEQAKTQQQVIAKLEQDLGWYRELEKRESSLEQAKQQQETATAALAETDADLALMEEVVRAETLRPIVDKLANARQQEQSHRQKLAQASEHLAQSQAAATEARETHARHRKAHDQAREQLEQARKPLAEAARMDLQLATQKEALQAVRNELEKLDTSIKKLQADRDQNQDNAASYRRQLENARIWLDHNAWVKDLERDWTHLKHQAKSLEKAQGEMDSCQAMLASIQASLEKNDQLLKTLKEEAESAKSELDHRKSEVLRLEKATHAASFEALGNKSDQLSEQIDQTQAIKAEIERYLEQEKACSKMRKDFSELQNNIAALTETLESQKQQKKQLATAVTDARAQVERLTQVNSLTAHRTTLKPGHPCPLCGALEHPLLEQEAPGQSEIKQAKNHLQELESQLNKLANEKSRYDGFLDRDREQLNQMAQNLDELSEAILQQKRELMQKLANADLETQTDWDKKALEDHLQRLAKRDLHLREELADLKQARQLAEVQNRDYREAQKAAREFQEECDKRDAKLEACRKARAELEEQQKRQQDRLEQARTQHRACSADLFPLVDKLWPSPPETLDSKAFINEAEKMLLKQQDFQKQERELDEAQRRCRDLQETTLLRLEETATERKPLAADLNDRQKALEALQHARGELLEGRDPETVRTELENALAACETATTQSSQKLQEQEQVVAAAQSSNTHADTAATQSKRDLESAEADLKTQLEAKQWNQEQLTELLAYGPDWVETTRERRQKLKQELEAARAVHRERREVLENHRAQPPSESKSRLQDLIAEAQEKQEELNTRRAQYQHQCSSDDENQAKRQQLVPGLEAQIQKADAWNRMSSLIGSHDGAKFRNFAQSLTLEHLLHYTNQHLEDLAPRYRLIRLQNTDLDLAVMDRHMLDEVRATASLSGGESFLVSLGLALGLSSMSANETPIESLFIDEGFGSLDADTLETALACLDALQQDGRQIGMISHVPNLAERIGVGVSVERIDGTTSRVTSSDFRL